MGRGKHSAKGMVETVLRIRPNGQIQVTLPLPLIRSLCWEDGDTLLMMRKNEGHVGYIVIYNEHRASKASQVDIKFKPVPIQVFTSKAARYREKLLKKHSAFVLKQKWAKNLIKRGVLSKEAILGNIWRHAVIPGLPLPVKVFDKEEEFSHWKKGKNLRRYVIID